MFLDVRVLIWDFDGTLFKPNQNLWHDIREAEYRTILSHTGWSREKTVEEFAKLYKIVYPSATEVAAALAGITIAEAVVEMEEYFDRRKYLTRDEKLIALFVKLKHFRHFTLANGAIARHKQALEVLGVRPEVFEEMITSEVVGVTKPHEAGFLYILKKTQLPASQHLMIGDRETVDVIPAKALGMKTCLVWSEQATSAADVTLPNVYNVVDLFIS